MGQYYKVVNLDKKQYLSPHDLDDGAKLMEFGQSAGGVMTALAVLLADGNGRGGGDIKSESSYVGLWAGDRIVITGDYADGGKFCTKEEVDKYCEENGTDSIARTEVNLYAVASKYYQNISKDIVRVLNEAGEGRHS